MTSQDVLAVDVGGTKLAAGIVDPGGRLGLRSSVPTVGEDAEDLFDRLCGLIDDVLSESGSSPRLIGIGCGGPMDLHHGRVSPLNIPLWRDFPLRDRVAERYRRDTYIDNDAKALALAEGWRGAAQGLGNHLAMVVSTGVGGGVVLDGRLLDGASGNAGHIGHVVVEPLGRRCACGGRGCLEAEASGTAIAEMTGAPAADAPIETRIRTGRLVGRGVASAVSLLDLHVVSVAGSVALGYGDPFFDAANQELQRLARLEFARGARVVPAGCGADGPLIGAAAVALRGAGSAS